jgi:hypothetical protein
VWNAIKVPALLQQLFALSHVFIGYKPIWVNYLERNRRRAQSGSPVALRIEE